MDIIIDVIVDYYLYFLAIFSNHTSYVSENLLELYYAKKCTECCISCTHQV